MTLDRSIAAAALAHAGSPHPAGGEWYMGLTVGSSNVGDTPEVVPLSGATSSVLVSDERDPGVKVLGGYRFNRRFAIEGGYAWVGEFQSEVRTLRTVTGQATPAPGLSATAYADEANLEYGRSGSSGWAAARPARSTSTCTRSG